MKADFDKDAWIRSALDPIRGIIAVNPDGKIYRYWKTENRKRLFKPIKLSIHKPTGRPYFTLTYAGISKSVLAYRVVAIARIPNPLGLPEVNHKHGDKASTHPDHLEWADRSSQEKHAHQTGLKASRGSANANAKLTPADVERIRKAPLETLSELAIVLKCSLKTIRDVRARRTWRHL